jgi:hypothetical protein
LLNETDLEIEGEDSVGAGGSRVDGMVANSGLGLALKQQRECLLLIAHLSHVNPLHNGSLSVITHGQLGLKRTKHNNQNQSRERETMIVSATVACL